MHFCRIRGVHPDPDLFLNGQRISCVEEAKFLGLIFDCKLTWEPQIRNLKVKCMKAVDILKVLSCTKWGADRKHLLQLHRSLVISKLSYGSEIFSSASKSRLDSLNSVHNAGVRISTGAFRSSPISSLLVDAGEIPLEFIRQSNMIRYWIRLQRLPDCLTFKVVFRNDFSCFYNKPSYPKPYGLRIKEILEDLQVPTGKILPAKLSVFPPWKLPSIEYCNCIVDSKKDQLNSVLKQKFLAHLNSHRNNVFIFTDGSKSDAGVGFEVAFPNFNLSGSLPSSASVFTSELYSILRALKQIVSTEGFNFTIFSDSRSVLEALGSFNYSHPFALEILEWLFLLNCKRKTIHFCWVPAHVGIQGNERADQLAKEGALRPSVDRGLPASDFFPGVKKTIKSAWQFYWTVEISNKMREITDTISPWVYLSSNRRREVALCRLRIGHTLFSHGFLMTRSYQPFCSDCIVPLTVRHLFVECPSLLEQREKYFNKDKDGNFKLSLILGEDLNEDSVFNFIEEAGFANQI